jgi:hypothetical protein
MWFHNQMRPLYVEKLTTEEIETLKQGLRSPSAFTVRRSQILLKSYESQKPQAIGEALQCSDQTVRMAIRAFNEEGLACLTEKSHARPDQAPLIDTTGWVWPIRRIGALVAASPGSCQQRLDTADAGPATLERGVCEPRSKCDVHQQCARSGGHRLVASQEMDTQHR